MNLNRRIGGGECHFGRSLLRQRSFFEIGQLLITPPSGFNRQPRASPDLQRQIRQHPLNRLALGQAAAKRHAVARMPGASSVIAANYVYNLAKADGLTILVPINSLYLDQIVGRKEVKFDVRKFEFIGTQEKAPTLLYFRADSPFKTLDDIIKAKEPPKCGSTGTASTGYLLAKIMDEAFKAKLNTVSGYQGGAEIDVAVERGEIICRGMDIPPHFGREPFDSWHKKGFDRHILQSGPKRDPRMGDAPTLFELMDQFKTPAVMRGVARVIMASGDFGRPMLIGPGNPPDRVKILREAYAKAMHDPGLIDEAKKSQMDMEYTPGEDLQTLMKELMNQPRDVIDRVKNVLAD